MQSITQCACMMQSKYLSVKHFVKLSVYNIDINTSILCLYLFVYYVCITFTYIWQGRRGFFFFFFIQYNKYNTVIEHISTPVPTVDNIRIQIYMLMLYIHNRQKRYIHTDIHTKSWTKYFIDRYLPCTKSD